LEDFDKEVREITEQLRRQAIDHLPIKGSRAANDVRDLRNVRLKTDDAGTAHALMGMWHTTADRAFYTRLSWAMLRAGWNHTRRYHVLKVMGADNDEILDAYMNESALHQLRVPRVLRLDEYDALREGLLTLAECGDDIIIVETLHIQLQEDEAKLLAMLEDVLGWQGDGSDRRIANALYFGLGWDKTQVRQAWVELDELRARELKTAVLWYRDESRT
jgi:hypothetical protein